MVAGSLRRVLPCHVALPCRAFWPAASETCQWHRETSVLYMVTMLQAREGCCLCFSIEGASCPCDLAWSPALANLLGPDRASLLLHLSGLHLFPELTSAHWVRRSRRASRAVPLQGRVAPGTASLHLVPQPLNWPLPLVCLQGPVNGSEPMSSLQDAHGSPS